MRTKKVLSVVAIVLAIGGVGLAIWKLFKKSKSTTSEVTSTSGSAASSGLSAFTVKTTDLNTTWEPVPTVSFDNGVLIGSGDQSAVSQMMLDGLNSNISNKEKLSKLIKWM